MARPRVFVSSTFYDLRHLRASLERFIEGLGYEPVLFEKGDVPYAEGKPLDQSCYAEVSNADILVLVIGGRYGSIRSQATAAADGRKQVVSITREEFRRANDRGIPIYVLVEHSVHAELETFRKNRDNDSVKYAHVDSIQVFEFLEEILGYGKPVQPFARPQDVESWLLAQWAGRFRDLIQGAVTSRSVEDMAAQVLALRETSDALRKYLEGLVEKILGEPGRALVAGEAQRMKENLEESNPFVRHCARIPGHTGPQVIRALADAESFADLLARLAAGAAQPERVERLRGFSGGPFRDANKARVVLGLAEFTDKPEPEASLLADASVGADAGRRQAVNPDENHDGEGNGRVIARDRKPETPRP